MGRTLFDKVWESHVVRRAEGLPDLLYIDLHLVHEVTSPQAFEGLRLAGRPVRRPDLTLATMDHNVPTGDDTPQDPLSQQQLDALARNCEEFGVPLYATGSGREGIVHVIGPELGLTQPGMTIVCGDSHTSTHGAFGALAFGIGTSEVEHVLATQTLPQRKPKSLRIRFVGEPAPGVTAKDYVLAAIGAARRRRRRRPRDRVRRPRDRGALDGGPADDLQHVDRGRRARRADRARRRHVRVPRAAARARPARLGTPRSSAGARCRPTTTRSSTASSRSTSSELRPQVTWGTNPGMVVPIDGVVPDPAELRRPRRPRGGRARARLHGARAGHADPRHRGRPRLHRLVHELAHRGPARGGRGRATGTTCIRRCARWSCRARRR